MITAKFGSKSFEVSSKKIYTPDGVSISEELNTEETEVSGKKPTVNVKGIKLKSLSFDIKLDSRFVDVYTEISYWEKILKAKTSQSFKLGSHTLGKFYLTKTDLKNITLAKNGDYTGATLSLSFKEDGKSANGSTNSLTATVANKVTAVKASTTSTSPKVRVDSIIKPRNRVRWYETAEGALKRTGRSGLAYAKSMTVRYTYSKGGKIVCVNPQGLGWLDLADVIIEKY